MSSKRGIQERRMSGTLNGIEILGNPGSGKTTIAMTLERRFPGEWLGREALIGRPRLAKRALLYIVLPVRYPALSRSLFRLARAADSSNTSEILRFCVMFLVYKRRLDQAVRRSEAMVLFDQGFLQLIWSILHESKPKDEYRRLIENVVRAVYRTSPLVICFVECDGRTAAQRVARRRGGRSRLDGLAEHEIEQHISNDEWIRDLIKEVLIETAGGFAILDGSAEPEANAEIVMDLVASTTKKLSDDWSAAGVGRSS